MLHVTTTRRFSCTSISRLKSCHGSLACGGGRVSDMLTLSLMSIRTVGGTSFAITVSYIGSMKNVVLPRLLRHLKIGRIRGLCYRPAKGFTRGPRPLRGGLKSVVGLVGNKGTSMTFIISPSMSHLTVVYRGNIVCNRRCALIAITSCMLGRAPNGAMSGLDSAHTLHSMAHGCNVRCGTSTMNRMGIIAGVGTAGTIVNNRKGNKIVCPTDRCKHSTLMNVTLFLDRLTRRNGGIDRLHTACPPCFVTGGHISLAPRVSMSTVLTGIGSVCGGRRVGSVSNIGVSFTSG